MATSNDPLATLPENIKAQMTPWMAAMLSEAATRPRRAAP